ncbi:hypothetical protein HDU76_005769 [Blyttiomyces sp. JEL0837]|nr:hypothetical protein HDU76_005769 [Blyttiomyces sp. JEL0837]
MLQNGIGAAEEVKQSLGSFDVIDAMWPFNVVEVSEGHFHQGNTVGPVFVRESVKGTILANAINASGIECKSTPQLDAILYGKLLINQNNAISALSGIPLKAEMYQYQYRNVWAACISETLAVYNAAGITPMLSAAPPWSLPYILKLPDFAFAIAAKGMLSVDEKATSSMYEDLKLHRKTEIEYIQGVISRMGKQYQIPTPVCDRVIDMIKDAENRNCGVVPHSGAEIMRGL